MEISVRELDECLLISLAGELPTNEGTRHEAERAIRKALSVQPDRCIINVERLNISVPHGRTLLAFLLRESGVEFGVLGGGPKVRLVSTDEGLQAAQKITDSPLLVFPTEDEAIASF